jgi:hypothetical protein
MAVIAGVAVVAGCGSSQLSLPPGGFHSATHQYSVRQVEAAFAAHGIRLHKAARQFYNVTDLRSGSGPHAVFVAVRTGGTTGAYPIPIPVHSKTLHGNVTVVWLSRGAAVSAALDELH